MISFHVGLDQSFASSGFALLGWDSETNKVSYEYSKLFHPSIKMHSKSDSVALVEHMGFLKHELNSVKEKGEIKSIGVEGIAFGARGATLGTLGAIWGIYTTISLGYADLIVIPPKSLKKYVTGSGNAEKEEVATVILKKYGLSEDDIETYDQSDALSLAEVAMYAWRIRNFGITKVKKQLTPAQLEVLYSEEKIKKKHKNSPEKQAGICHRLDDFYITKREPK